MKGMIYLIENKINGKKYIGQTTLSVHKRWLNHCKDARMGNDRPLCRAIRKYGQNNFIVSTIEVVDIQVLSDREKHWITFYDTYHGDGYNATLGGEGTLTVDRDKVIQLYEQYQNQNEVARQLNIHRDTVRDILNSCHISTLSSEEVNKNRGNRVSAYDYKTHEFVKSFDSQLQAGRWLAEQGKTKIAKLTHLSYVIGRVAQGKDNRKQAYGYIWKYE